MKVLFHLVSGQNLPNYIADKIINPDENLFLCSKESLNQFNIIEKNLPNSKPENIESWDYEKIQNQIKDLLCNYALDEVILNFTAGNKIMALAAFDLFRNQLKKCIYINTEQNEYIVFDNSVNEIHKYPIDVKFTISEILSFNNQDFEFGDRSLSEDYEVLMDIILKNRDLQNTFLKFAKKYSNLKNDFKENIKKAKWSGSSISYSVNESTIKLIRDGNEIVSLKDRGYNLPKFIFGEWFEFVCLKVLRDLNFFDEIKHDVTIIRKVKKANDRSINKNQIDIFGIKGIYNYIFECKSGNIRADAVDKLVAIKETYVGRYASLFFISKFPLDERNDIHKNIQEKITDNGIYHLTYNDLLDKNKIIDIFNERKNLK
jgi:hypothetical protein